MVNYKDIKNTVLYSALFNVYKTKLLLQKKLPIVKSSDQTIDCILKTNKSVSRFGDGEFRWIFQENDSTQFEKNSPQLAKRLLEVLNNKKDNIIVCVPEFLVSLRNLRPSSRIYWGKFSKMYGKKVINLLSNSKIYYDTQFTRPYMDYKFINPRIYKERFTNLKKIWEDRNVLIVEGKESRFGVASDLLDNSKSVKRIICPSKNAFESYVQILETVKNEGKSIENVLVLISLGPTATVLAYDLSNIMQSIDIGHLDVEYQWFKMGARSKVPIPGKYVNEASKKWVKELNKKDLDKYKREIIKDIS
ncbi:MAG: GT-D fold domain-containing glycosyltransferase [Lactobacillus crispatus]